MDADLAGLKQAVALEVEKRRDLLGAVIRTLDGFAEIGGEEVRSCRYLCDVLSQAGFSVEEGIVGLPTAFLARGGPGGRGAPCVALLAEYDALPGIGHGCGHDASAAASLGAAIALLSSLETAGHAAQIMVVGTPGEENLSCKIEMVERGVFRGVDAALMVHAFDRWLTALETMALDAREYTFTGRAAHAAAAPEMGVNALDAVILTFQAVNCLRQHIPDGCRVHGVVTHGGDVPNIVPACAQARFYVRAPSRGYLDTLSPRIDRCAEAAALATGCSLEASTFEASVDDISLNRPFLDLFEANLRAVDPPVSFSLDTVPLGSTDVGNLSYAVPTIHPLAGFAPLGTVLHTKEFADEMLTADALQSVCVAATVLAQTALDLVVGPRRLAEVRSAFEAPAGASR